MPTDPWTALMTTQPKDPWRQVETTKWGWPGTLENMSRLGEYGYGEGTRLLGRAEQSLDPLLGFFRTILGGDRQAAMNLMAPEISTIVSQYDAARKAAAEFAPRGGGKTQALVEAPFKQAGEIEKVLQQARQGALGGLERIGGTYGQLGGQELGLAGATWQGLIGDVLVKYAIDKKQRADTAKSLGGLLAMLLGGGTLQDFAREATTRAMVRPPAIIDVPLLEVPGVFGPGTRRVEVPGVTENVPRTGGKR